MPNRAQSWLEVLASARRIRALSYYALGEALHLRLALVLGLTGVVLCSGAFSLRQFSFGRAELKFIADFGWAVIGLTSLVLGTLVTTQLFFRDLESRTVQAVLTRPVRRWEYLVGKFAGVAGWLAGYVATLGLLLTALLFWRGWQIGAPPPVGLPYLVAGAILWMKSTLVAALTLLVCSYAGSVLFASCTGLLLALIGHLRSLPAGDRLLALQLWPNLALFDPEKLIAGTAVTFPWLLGLVGYWSAYLLLLGALASYGFKHRQF